VQILTRRVGWPSLGSGEVLTTIDGQRGSGDETCFIRHQKYNSPCDFLGFAKTPYRDGADDLMFSIDSCYNS